MAPIKKFSLFIMFIFCSPFYSPDKIFKSSFNGQFMPTNISQVSLVCIQNVMIAAADCCLEIIVLLYYILEQVSVNLADHGPLYSR